VGGGWREVVAHAVTTSLAAPILLEAAARASPNLRDGWQGNASVTTDRSRGGKPGSCSGSTMQVAGYGARGCLGRRGIGLLQEQLSSVAEKEKNKLGSQYLRLQTG
jgi:hypothetical protein